MNDETNLRALVASTNAELENLSVRSRGSERSSNAHYGMTFVITAVLCVFVIWQASTLLFKTLEEPLTTQVEIANFRTNIVEHILTFSIEHNRLPENLREVFQSSLDNVSNGTITFAYAKDETGFSLEIFKNGQRLDSYRGEAP